MKSLITKQCIEDDTDCFIMMVGYNFVTDKCDLLPYNTISCKHCWSIWMPTSQCILLWLCITSWCMDDCRFLHFGKLHTPCWLQMQAWRARYASLFTPPVVCPSQDKTTRCKWKHMGDLWVAMGHILLVLGRRRLLLLLCSTIMCCHFFEFGIFRCLASLNKFRVLQVWDLWKAYRYWLQGSVLQGKTLAWGLLQVLELSG